MELIIGALVAYIIYWLFFKKEKLDFEIETEAERDFFIKRAHAVLTGKFDRASLSEGFFLIRKDHHFFLEINEQEILISKAKIKELIKHVEAVSFQENQSKAI